MKIPRAFFHTHCIYLITTDRRLRLQGGVLMHLHYPMLITDHADIYVYIYMYIYICVYNILVQLVLEHSI